MSKFAIFICSLIYVSHIPQIIANLFGHLFWFIHFINSLYSLGNHEFMEKERDLNPRIVTNANDLPV